MKCDLILERLDDYVDGALSEAEFQEIELHLQGCVPCREEERLLRSLLSHAAGLPREMAPPRDLWQGISERLTTRKSLDRRFGAFFLSPLVLAAACVAIALVATRYTPHPRTAAPSAAVVNASFDPSLTEAEQQYGRATTALKTALDTKRASLSPETQQAVDNNLRIIDNALQSLRTALQKDPGNPELTQLLIATHRKKLDILQQVTRLADAL
jgi:anti-sigma factor RsiW